MKLLTRSIIPSMGALAALIAFLPRTGPAVGLVTTEFTFTPQRPVVAVGESITIRNDGDLTHSFTCPECGSPSVDIQPGQAKVVRFARAGRFEFWCIYHRDGDMAGTITVEGAARPAPSPSPSPDSTESPAG